MTDIKIIAFDADDTLWINEPLFQQTEKRFCEMLEDYIPEHTISRELFAIEMQNLSKYGYGIKAFMLSMIEAAIKISEKTISIDVIENIITLGKKMLDEPVVLIDGVEKVLQELQGKYKLVMATKGDLVDQEKKLEKSGLSKYFHHTEIVSDKKELEYEKLIGHLDIDPHHFLMVGNSLKSDIIPVLNIGGHAIHVPYHVTWEHEKIDTKIDHPNFKQLEKISQVLDHIH